MTKEQIGRNTKRRIGKVPTAVVADLQSDTRAFGHKYETQIDPENYRHTVVFSDCDLAQEWFRGWAAAKRTS